MIGLIVLFYFKVILKVSLFSKSMLESSNDEAWLGYQLRHFFYCLDLYCVCICVCVYIYTQNIYKITMCVHERGRERDL